MKGALPFHFETTVNVNTPARALFAFLDDHRRITGHMSRRSWMMAGGRMDTQLDPDEGRAVGSRIRLSGRVLGLRIALEEAVTEREPPVLKTWETTAEPRLVVIGPYRMGFRIVPESAGARLTVFIDWALPRRGIDRWLARLLGGWYARWCTRRMANAAAVRFAGTAGERHYGEPADREGG